MLPGIELHASDNEDRSDESLLVVEGHSDEAHHHDERHRVLTSVQMGVGLRPDMVGHLSKRAIISSPGRSDRRQ